MQEMIPLACGAVVGLIVERVRSARLRALALVVLCVLAGAFASFVNGELAEGWAIFLSFDMALVWVGALLTVLATTAGRRALARR